MHKANQDQKNSLKSFGMVVKHFRFILTNLRRVEAENQV